MRDGKSSNILERHKVLQLIFVMSLSAAMPFITGCQTERVETDGRQDRHDKTRSAKVADRPMIAAKPGTDKDMAAVLKELQALNPKPIVSLSAEEARVQPTPADAVIAMTRDRKPTPTSVNKTKDLQIPGPGGPLPIRIYTPQGSSPFPVIMYYHGGGWVIGTIETYDASARILAQATNAIVVAVEYRKAPEHKFPAAHEDAYAAYQWVLRNAEIFDGDPAMIAVAGESAGGNLAAAVCLMARARGEVLPVHQALIYPVAGYDFDTPSYQENAQAKPLDRPMMRWFFEKYLRDAKDGNNAWIDLVNAPNLSGLPSATIITAEIDPLQSEGKRYAERLLEDGVPVMYRNFKGVTHEFFGMGAVVGDANQAVQLVANGLMGSFDDPVFLRQKNKSGHAPQLEPLQD